MFLANAIGENVFNALSSMNLWIAVCKSIFIILLGFILAKTGVLKDGTSKTLTKIVMVIALPCLAFSSFMSNITKASFSSAIFSFIYGFIIYTAFIFLSKLIFRFVKEPTRRRVLEILFIFGSTTFFGQPLINAVFPNAYNDSNMFNISYRIFLYSYAYIAIVGSKTEEVTSTKATLKTIFLNPIIIATFAGFMLWALQLIPGTTESTSWWTVTSGEVSYAFWRIDITMPWLFQTVKLLGSLASPLVWIAIGCTLARISFRQAASDKMAWLYCVIKIIGAPLLNLCLLLFINTFYKVSFNVVAATTIMWAVPPATVAVSYCIDADKEAVFASNCSLLSTFFAVLFIPIYMVILTLIQSGGMFI